MYSNNYDLNYSLLDLAFSIYIFYNKTKFTNSRKVIKEQRSLCSTNVILIEDW